MGYPNVNQIAAGNAGLAPGQSLQAFLTAITNTRLTAVAGAAGGTKLPVADMRLGDVLIGTLNNNAGTITDIAFVAGAKASGTLTFASAVANDTFVVAGVTFTLKASPDPAIFTEVPVRPTDALQAASAVDHIIKFFTDTDGAVTASANGAVVTVSATHTGTSGNAYTTVGGTRITAGGATMSGGTADTGVTIFDTRASGTLTFSGAVAGDTCEVDGITFTIQDASTYDPDNFLHILLGTSNRLTASNAAKALHRFFTNRDGLLTASVFNNVVTVRGTIEGTTSQNSVTLVGGTHITASGATLAGGTATGGIVSTGATNQVLLLWANVP